MKNPLDSVGLTITLGVVFAIVVMVVMPGAEYNDPGLSRWLHIYISMVSFAILSRLSPRDTPVHFSAGSPDWTTC